MRPGCMGDSIGLHCTLVTCMNCVPKGTLNWFEFILDCLKLAVSSPGHFAGILPDTIYMSQLSSVCNFSFLALVILRSCEHRHR